MAMGRREKATMQHSGADGCIYHNNFSNGDTSTRLGMNIFQDGRH